MNILTKGQFVVSALNQSRSILSKRLKCPFYPCWQVKGGEFVSRLLKYDLQGKNDVSIG